MFTCPLIICSSLYQHLTAHSHFFVFLLFVGTDIIMATYHRLFVYGTLKRGQPNAEQFVPENGFVKYVGQARTVQKWPLVIASQCNIPYLLDREGIGNVCSASLNLVLVEKLLHCCRITTVDSPRTCLRHTLAGRYCLCGWSVMWLKGTLGRTVGWSRAAKIRKFDPPQKQHL